MVSVPINVFPATGATIQIKGVNERVEYPVMQVHTGGVAPLELE